MPRALVGVVTLAVLAGVMSLRVFTADISTDWLPPEIQDGFTLAVWSIRRHRDDAPGGRGSGGWIPRPTARRIRDARDC